MIPHCCHYGWPCHQTGSIPQPWCKCVDFERWWEAQDWLPLCHHACHIRWTWGYHDVFKLATGPKEKAVWGKKVKNWIQMWVYTSFLSLQLTYKLDSDLWRRCTSIWRPWARLEPRSPPKIRLTWIKIMNSWINGVSLTFKRCCIISLPAFRADQGHLSVALGDEEPHIWAS